MKDSQKLDNEHKTHIIQRLAEFRTLKSIQDFLFKEYGVMVSLQNISQYRKRYEQEIKDLRKEYLKETATIGISHLKHRLAMRQKMVDYIINNNKESLFYVCNAILRDASADVDGYHPVDAILTQHDILEIT